MKNKIKQLNQYWTDIYFHMHYIHKEPLTHQGVRILQLVEKEDKTGVSEIATYLQISNNTASEHVKRMIEKNYLIKIRNPHDERKVILGLTDEGKEVLHRHTSLDEEKLERLIGELNEEEIQMIEQAFKLLSERSKQ